MFWVSAPGREMHIFSAVCCMMCLFELNLVRVPAAIVQSLSNGAASCNVAFSVFQRPGGNSLLHQMILALCCSTRKKHHIDFVESSI